VPGEAHCKSLYLKRKIVDHKKQVQSDNSMKSATANQQVTKKQLVGNAQIVS